MDDQVFLKPNVQVEPLFNQWYAWQHLLSPATAAMNIANLHVKIMKSFVAAPQIHANALKNPAMAGGPFIDYPSRRVPEIKELLAKTLREQSHMIELAAGIQTLDDLLRRDAKGFSLEELYPRVPASLRGYVELVYDLNNNPSIRFIERLLYKSKYYDTSSQALSLKLISRDDRAFALSTPRLHDPEALQLNLPFAHEGVDALFQMKEAAQPFPKIMELLGIPAAEGEKARSLFTHERAPSSPRPIERGIRARYLGHASVLIETRDATFLVDPAISYHFGVDDQRLTYQDLPDTIDYVLITHSHQDHILLESLLQIRYKVKTVVVPRNGGGGLQDPSLKLMLENIGFRNVVEIDELESLDVPGGQLVGLPFLGEHSDLNIRTKVAYFLRLGGKSFLFAADSNNIEPMLYEHLYEILGEVDVLFLGMECEGAPLSWLYGPLLTKPLDRAMDQSRRLTGSDYERGIGIVRRFNCKEVYVYAMGQEPWLGYIMNIKYTDASPAMVASKRLIEDCRGRGVPAELLYVKKEFHYPA